MQGISILHELTDYINSLNSTIKFTMVFLDKWLTMLDLTLSFVGGFIQTNIFSKLTDNHIYLHSLLPIHSIVSGLFLMGVQLKIVEIILMIKFFNNS